MWYHETQTTVYVHDTSQALHTANMAQTKQHTVFFHPDLGIGGAERLVVDAAVALQERGHPRHCFDEARDGKLPLLLTATHRLCTEKAAET
jgi:hypothetical protein